MLKANVEDVIWAFGFRILECFYNVRDIIGGEGGRL